MKHLNILIDFDETMAYRNGMWTTTIHQILQENGYPDITQEMIAPFTRYGFPWHDFNTPHRDFFKGKPWWEYMNQVIGQAIVNAGVDSSHAPGLTARFKDCYLDIDYWNLFESLKYIFD